MQALDSLIELNRYTAAEFTDTSVIANFERFMRAILLSPAITLARSDGYPNDKITQELAMRVTVGIQPTPPFRSE